MFPTVPVVAPASDSELEHLGPIVLIGHRGSGKTTLGKALSTHLNLSFLDLDAALRAELGNEFSATLNKSPELFRALEARLLDDALSTHKSLVLSPGAGASPSPKKGLLIWIDREDWRDEVGRSDRPRIRPDLTLEAELKWMAATRSSAYRAAAHLRLPIPRGRSIEQSTRELISLVRFAARIKDSPLAHKTYLVPTGPDDLRRANADARRLRLGGLELRSDYFPAPARSRDLPYIASLRHNDPTWLLRSREPCAWDIDLLFFDQLIPRLPRILPAEIILSLHPDRPESSHIEALARAARRLHRAGVSYSSIILKYAPRIQNFDELQRALSLLTMLKAIPTRATLLPQGDKFAWLRPILAAQNATNYLPVGLPAADADHPSRLDLDAFLPHLSAPEPRQFDLLIGDPVHASQGDRWHRSFSLTNSFEPHQGYLKVPIQNGELAQALALFETLPIRGVSVTSPLKREAAADAFIHNPGKLEALNTLRREDVPLTDNSTARWVGIDTDQAGMEAVLIQLEDRSVGPGTALVFGRGGASFAVCRALKARNWTIAAHLSARAGWTSRPDNLNDVTLIINAAGPSLAYRHSDAIPSAQAWIDLHYIDVQPPPTEAIRSTEDKIIHIQGDLFFEAQALAQRKFWKTTES